MRWTLDIPPTWAKGNAIATSKGWVDSVTGEVLVALGSLNTKGGSADALSIAFGAASYEREDELSIIVKHNEKVSVSAGANVVATMVGYSVDPAAATGTLTATDNAANGETITLGSKVYTFETTLTNVNGNVLIGATASDSLDNLIAAINLSAGAGTLYATAMTIHPTVSAAVGAGDTMVVTAKTGGTAGNSIASTSTVANAAFGAVTLENGDAGTALSDITLYAAAQTNVSSVVYNKVSGLDSNVVLPNAAATISIGAQTITGTYVDTASAIAATGTLTATDNFANNETVVLNGKTYTFKTTLTNTDGFVEIQSTLKKSLAALSSAINLSAGGAAQYAAATTLHPTMSAKAVGDTIVLTAKTPGTGGNSLTTTETATNASFGGGTLSGGVADVSSNKVISAGQATAAGTRVVA